MSGESEAASRMRAVVASALAQLQTRLTRVAAHAARTASRAQCAALAPAIAAVVAAQRRLATVRSPPHAGTLRNG